MGLSWWPRELESTAADAPPVADIPFTLPPGFVAERVAGAPLVEHPVMASFDNQGRLYVAESAGMNLKADDLLQQLPNSIKRLEDTNGDGQFDKATIFADKMSFPMGVLWHKGAVYTCSPPSLWKLEDTDGDGVADNRTELVTRFNFTGNAADIHGPFLGPDGWLYWADGRHGHEITQADGTVLKGKAARIFRCKLDGSQVETVCGGGMDNPVEVAFTAEGEPFCTANIVIGSPRNDAILYCIEGGVYPRAEFVTSLNEFKLTGDLLPPVVNLGWVAPSGLMRYRGAAFGEEFKDNLLSTQFNTHKVQRHLLKRDGAGFSAQSVEFLTSQQPDFHPTDVLEDADGSLLVIDTGGWFRIGCPTSQIAKPDIKGAIYRIRKQDMPKVEDPWGKKIPWRELKPEELTPYLDDPRWAVRDEAVNELAARGDQALAALRGVLRSTKPPLARRNAVWALSRSLNNVRLRDWPTSAAPLLLALQDSEDAVRLAAVHALGLNRVHHANAQLRQLLNNDPTPAVRRAAAAALSRLGNSRVEATSAESNDAVPALLLALKQAANDRFLDHAIIHALITINDPKATQMGLTDANPSVRRGALIALDQMDDGTLEQEQVVPLLDSDDLSLQQTVWHIITKRPAWASSVIGLVRDWLKQGELSPSRQEMVRAAILSFCKDEGLQQLVADVLREDATPPATRLLLLEALAQVPLEKLPATWINQLGDQLRHGDERVVAQAIVTLRARNVTEHDALLTRIAHDAKRLPETRVAALGASAPRLPRLTADLFALLRSRLHPDLPPLARLAAAEALGQAPLTDEQLRTLAQDLPKAGALEMPHLLTAFERGQNAEVGKQLVASLEKAPGLDSLTPDGLRAALKRYPLAVQTAAAPLFQRLEIDTAAQQTRLAELAPVLEGGDPKNGRRVFFGNKAACATCHAVGNDGGKIGPELSKIAGIRTGCDLLEAVVFPSASFVRGYEPYVIATRQGRLYTGIIGRQTADAIFLVTTERNEIRIPRADIETLDPNRVSIMPQGLDTQLTRQELADLLAFLQTLK